MNKLTKERKVTTIYYMQEQIARANKAEVIKRYVRNLHKFDAEQFVDALFDREDIDNEKVFTDFYKRCSITNKITFIANNMLVKGLIN